jgi:hypothetical protein
VTVTVVPAVALVAGEVVALIPVHGTTASEYWNALKASYEAELLASRAQTEKRYEPWGLPAVFQVKPALLE